MVIKQLEDYDNEMSQDYTLEDENELTFDLEGAEQDSEKDDGDTEEGPQLETDAISIYLADLRYASIELNPSGTY